METEKYLTEERYQKSKNKIKIIALIIFVVGLLIGGSLIATGVVKQNQAKNEASEKNSGRTESQVQADIDSIQAQIDDINAQINNIDLEINNLANEKTQIFMEDRGFSDRYYAKDNEINQKRAEKTTKSQELTKLENKNSELDSELWKIKSGFNDVKSKANSSIDSIEYIPYYMFGGFIIFVTCIIAGVIYLITKRREILAFGTQQVMPVAQEGIEKMAPTVGNAAKEISKGITQGIEEGKNNMEK